VCLFVGKKVTSNSPMYMQVTCLPNQQITVTQVIGARLRLVNVNSKVTCEPANNE